jgi:hypothetical protein
VSSSTPEQLEPAQFLPLPGGFAVLPPNARPDRAFERVINFTPFDPVAGTGAFDYHVPQLFYVVLLVMQASLRVSGASGTQSPWLAVLDESSNPVMQITSIATQPTNSLYSYTWAANVAAAYNQGVSTVLPWPIVVAQPGYTLRLNADGAGSNLNLWFPNAATMLFVPSGPAIANELGPPAPAPLTPVIV